MGLSSIFMGNISGPFQGYNPVQRDLFVMALVFAGIFLTILLISIIPAVRAGRRLKSRHLKGAAIGDKNSYIKFIDKNFKSGVILELSGIPIPVSEETKGFFFTGKPGVGKTLSFYKILSGLKKESMACRGKPCKKIVYDFKGDYVSKFYNEKDDLIFNPLDVRSVKWDIYSEFRGNETARVVMAERIAASVIPDNHGKTGNNEKFWRDGAREVFAAMLNCLRLENKGSIGALNEMLSLGPAEIGSRINIHKISSNAANFLSPPDSPQAGGIMATLTQFTKFFKYMAYTGEAGFSITDWLSDGKDNTIFVVNKSDLQDILRPMLTLFIDIISGGILAFPEDPDRRIFLLIDEMGTLHELPTLVNLLSFGRSKGASAWLAVQDFSQLDYLYGEHRRKSIINACTTHVYFSVADNTTAETISRLIGEEEAIEESRTSGPGGAMSRTRYKQKKPVLLPSEIMRMKPFEFIYRGNIYQPFFDKLDPSDFSCYRDKSEPFIMRPDGYF